jgi:Na+/H+-dicarboxylate symporter
MHVSKKRMGVPEDIVNMLAPPAATINMHATCLEIPIYVLFTANVFGIELTTGQLLLTIGMGILSSVGSAALPGGGIVMDAIVLELMGMPLTVLPWIVGVYTLIDMPGTMLNVTGDTVGLAVISDRLKELKRDIFNGSKPLRRDTG